MSDWCKRLVSWLFDPIPPIATRYDVGWLPGPAYVDQQNRGIGTSDINGMVWWLTDEERVRLEFTVDRQFGVTAMRRVPEKVLGLITGHAPQHPGKAPCWLCDGTGEDKRWGIDPDGCRWCLPERKRIEANGREFIGCDVEGGE